MGHLVQTEGKFMGVSTCKNEDYFMAEFALPELYKGNVMDYKNFAEPNCKILCKSKDYQTYKELKAGDTYQLQLGVDVNQSRESDGRKYRASVSYTIHKMTPKQ